MSASLDINLLPVARYAGRDYPELLCLYASEPPRRRARGRDADRLALYLAMVGNAPLPPGKQDQALADLAKLYYETPGSVTAGLRRVAEELNKALLERNLLLASSSRQGLGILVQLAMRQSQITLAISGPAQAFLISSGQTQRFADADMAQRGLGQSRETPLSLYQVSLQANDTLILAAQSAPEWEPSALASLYGQGPESLRRKLFSPSITDVNAVIVQARPGKGKINLPKPVKPMPQTSVGTARTAPKAPTPQAPVKTPTQATPQPVASEGVPTEASVGQIIERSPAPTPAAPEATEAALVETPTAEASTLPEVIKVPPPPAEISSVSTAAAEPEPLLVGDQESVPTRPKRRFAPGSLASTALAALFGALRAVGRGLSRLLTRILPEDALLSIPSTVMAFTALAAPVIIVTIASLVYMRLGRNAQFEIYYSQAQQIAERGLGQSDVAARYADLEIALELLRKAELYGSDPNIQGLRARVRSAMDDLELIKRVLYQPAIVGGLPAAVKVTEIVALEDNLYLLDGNSGNVIRARLTSQGYQVDAEFQCGVNVGGIPGLKPLIDIEAWPPGFTPEASLLAMDAFGGVLYCLPDASPKSDRLKASEEGALSDVSGFALDLGDAYVLDRASNQVWIYRRSELTVDPKPFFNQEVPELNDVVDLAVNRDDLYLLHADGALTLCFYSEFEGVPTRCSQPPYVDFRPGRENLPLTPPSPFAKIQNTLPPDPSLFLLEPATRAIYHFSLRNLSFQRQYMPDRELAPGPATAFAVDNIQRYLFLAIGNQVYYAVLP
jgi:hypothetical protein